MAHDLIVPDAAGAPVRPGVLAWCERLGLTLPLIQPVHVAAWVEQLGRDGRAAPTVKQQLATVRMLFDWLVVGQVLAHNPAAAVRGPRYSLAGVVQKVPFQVTPEIDRAMMVKGFLVLGVALI